MVIMILPYLGCNESLVGFLWCNKMKSQRRIDLTSKSLVSLLLSRIFHSPMDRGSKASCPLQ